MSEAVNLVMQWIFVLNSVKHNFFHVSIVNAAKRLLVKVFVLKQIETPYIPLKMVLGMFTITLCLTLFRMGFFGAAHVRSYNHETWHGYTSHKKDPKIYLNHVKHPVRSADISFFLMEIKHFFYIKKYRYRLLSAKDITPGLCKMKVFWKKDYWRQQQNFLTWFKL